MWSYTTLVVILCGSLAAACTAPNPHFEPDQPEPIQRSPSRPPSGNRSDAGTTPPPGTAPAPSTTPSAPSPPTSPTEIPDGGTAPLSDAGVSDDGNAAATDSAPISAAKPDAAPPFTGDLLKGLTLYLPLDDMPGTGVATDASGKRSSATLRNIDLQQAWIGGKSGNAVALEGGSWMGWVDVNGNNLVTAISEAFTLALFIKRTDADGTLISRRAPGVKGHHLTLSVQSGQLVAAMNTKAAYNVKVTSGKAVPVGEWTHVAMTYDRAQVKLFVDGLPVAAAPYQQGLPLDTTPLVVGGLEQENKTVTSRFPGKIDEVVLYTRALPIAELKALASGRRPVR